MSESAIVLPLIIILTGALIAALCGLPWLNRRLNVTQLSWLLALAPLSSFCILVSFLDDLQANLVFSWKGAWLPSIGLNGTLF